MCVCVGGRLIELKMLCQKISIRLRWLSVLVYSPALPFFDRFVFKG